MKTTLEFLDMVKAKYHLPSDYALAHKLDLTRSGVSKFRTGKAFLGDETACKVADLLELERSYVMACIAAEQAKMPEVKAAWKHAADVLYGLAAALALVAVLPFVTLPYNDAGIVASTSSCILCKIAFLSYWWLFAPAFIIAALYFPKKPRNETVPD